jgi:hypothetical protein
MVIDRILLDTSAYIALQRSKPDTQKRSFFWMESDRFLLLNTAKSDRLALWFGKAIVLLEKVIIG